MVCFRYIIVNTLYKGDKKDDDDDNNNFKKYNMESTLNVAQIIPTGQLQHYMS